jgi:hypothetical protein
MAGTSFRRAAVPQEVRHPGDPAADHHAQADARVAFFEPDWKLNQYDRPKPKVPGAEEATTPKSN